MKTPASQHISLLIDCACLGIAGGLRASAPIAALAWKSESQASKAFGAAIWLGEMVVDKLPLTPDRRWWPSLLGRIASGALAGVVRARSAGLSPYGGALGALGAIAGAYAGAAFRAEAGEHAPKLAVAVTEDAIATRLARWAARRISVA